MKKNNKSSWFLKATIPLIVIVSSITYFTSFSTSSSSYGNYSSIGKSSSGPIPNRLKWKKSFAYKKDKTSYMDYMSGKNK